MTATATTARTTLGDFMSTVCFGYLINAAEDLAGNAVIMDAGRQRGQDIVKEHGLAGAVQDPDAIRETLNKIVGPDGTKLCIIESITATDDGGYTVTVSEPASHIYALGVLIGSVGTISGKTMLGKQEDMGGGKHAYHISPL